MKIVVLDSTGIVDEGPGSAAYFSRHTIDHLRAQGHTVDVRPGFDPGICAAADIVWTEWCNEEAFAAVLSGACKRLVLRMRGYDLWAPLEKLKDTWSRVDTLVYESPMLEAMARERFPFLHDVKSRLIPSGIDLSRFRIRVRGHGKTVALLARAIADKGYQLAVEWARQNPDYTLHMTAALGEHNHRLVKYLHDMAPSNVIIHEQKDPATWLDEIGANYLLSASNWETLGYTIIEAMALGIKPLIHEFPGARHNWPPHFLWRSFHDLNALMAPGSPYESEQYRDHVEAEYDAAIQAETFTTLLEEIADKPPTKRPAPIDPLMTFHHALKGGDLDRASQIATDTQIPSIMIQLAAAYYSTEKYDKAAMWAHLSMREEPRTDALCLLGEIAVDEDHLEAARDWYHAACMLHHEPQPIEITPLVNGRHERWDEIAVDLTPKHLARIGAPPVYKFIVPVRNGAKWIRRCLDSIAAQDDRATIEIIVINDASTDDTSAEIKQFQLYLDTERDIEVTVIANQERMWSLPSIVKGITKHGSQSDETVIIIVDGDDWLTSNALETVNEEYIEGAWMTYGSFMDTDGKPSWMGAYPQRVVRDGKYRQFAWRGSHLKTFKQWLFRKIDYSAFKDDNGNWFHITGDVALMLPLLEMARERAHYIPTPIYNYNVETPDNDHKTAAVEQVRIRDMIFARNRHIYPQIPDKNALVSLHVKGEEIDVLQEYIHKGDTVFDVGCANGEWSGAAHHFVNDLKIHAFDPREEVSSAYTARLTGANAILHHCAMSETEGSREFYRFTRGLEGSSFYPRAHLPNGEAREKITVAVTTIDAYAKRAEVSRIQFLKIDAEGHDAFVLRGAQQMLQNGHIDCVQFEYGPPWKDAGVGIKDALTCLHDFHIYRIDKGLQEIDAANIIDDFVEVNYLAVRKGAQ